MTNFETNKKHAADKLAGSFVVFTIIVLLATAWCFGHYTGVEKVRKEAVYKGYAEFDKDGYFHWKSRRAIEQGGRG